LFSLSFFFLLFLGHDPLRNSRFDPWLCVSGDLASSPWQLTLGDLAVVKPIPWTLRKGPLWLCTGNEGRGCYGVWPSGMDSRSSVCGLVDCRRRQWWNGIGAWILRWIRLINRTPVCLSSSQMVGSWLCVYSLSLYGFS
jgi:hypothetical protein